MAKQSSLPRKQHMTLPLKQKISKNNIPNSKLTPAVGKSASLTDRLFANLLPRLVA